MMSASSAALDKDEPKNHEGDIRDHGRANEEMKDDGLAPVNKLNQNLVQTCIENPWKDSRKRELDYIKQIASDDDLVMDDARKVLKRGVDLSPEQVLTRIRDLDGDGQDEAVYTWNGLIAHWAPFYIYLSGNGCATYAGTVFANIEGEFKLTQKNVNSMPIIYSYVKDIGPFGIDYTYHWSVTNSRYEEVETRYCCQAYELKDKELKDHCKMDKDGKEYPKCRKLNFMQ